MTMNCPYVLATDEDGVVSRKITRVFGADQLDHVLESGAIVALEVGDSDNVILARFLRVQKRYRKMNCCAWL